MASRTMSTGPDPEIHRSRPGSRESTTTEAKRLRSMFFTFLLLDDEAKWKRSFSKRNQIGVRRVSPLGSWVASTA